MRSLFLFAVMFLTTLFAFAQNDKGIDPVAFEKSKKAFEEAKLVHNNSYLFSIKTTSWTGYWTKTTYVVENGVVTERHYMVGNEMKGEGKIEKQWHEKGKKVGSHTDEGKPVMTMDDVYREAQAWLVTENKEGNAEYFFSTNDEGVISMAGLVDKDCVDDCYRGYRIEGFVWTSFPAETELPKAN